VFSRTLERERPGSREGYDAGSGEGAGGGGRGSILALELDQSADKLDLWPSAKAASSCKPVSTQSSRRSYDSRRGKAFGSSQTKEDSRSRTKRRKSRLIITGECTIECFLLTKRTKDLSPSQEQRKQPCSSTIDMSWSRRCLSEKQVQRRQNPWDPSTPENWNQTPDL
jgi:hypothetical protein